MRPGSPVGAHVGPRGAMTVDVANDPIERRGAPGWRPGPGAGRCVALPGSDLRLRSAPAPLRWLGWLGRGDGLRLCGRGLRSLAGESGLAERVRIGVPVELAHSPESILL